MAAEARFVYLYAAVIHPLAGSSGEISIVDAWKDARSKSRKMFEKTVDPAMKYEEGSTQERREEIRRCIIQRHQEVQDFIVTNAGADFFSEEVKILQNQIDELLALRLTITDIHDSLPRGKALLSGIEVFYIDYAFVMQLHPDLEACGIKELRNLNQIRAIEWTFGYYYSAGNVLKDMEYKTSDHNEVHTDAVREMRIGMAIWALEGNLVKVPNITPTLATELWNALDDDLKWIVDWTVVLPLGLQFIARNLKLIWVEMENVIENISTLTELMCDLRKYRIYDPVDPRVDLAVTSHDETCPICQVEYTRDDSTAAEDEEAPGEPAVKLRGCNHVMGLHCLQVWISQQAQHCTCPLCRAPFFDENDPTTIYGAVAQVMRLGIWHIDYNRGSIELFKAMMPEVIGFFREPRAQMSNPDLPPRIVQHAGYFHELVRVGDRSEVVLNTTMFRDSSEHGGPVPHRPSPS